MRKKKVIVISLIIGFFLYIIFTGELAISNRKDFGGQRNIVLAKGLQTDVWLQPQSSKWGIPFLIHYYGRSKPYALRIQIWDESKTFTKIEIKEIQVTYSDGNTVLHTEGWDRFLVDYKQIALLLGL